ncbi:CoA binding domain-containing protein [Dichotomopilus funicola]|uniref:CoA binding domain-containing protein n=1 Tax=Dichotomopilus funicola TaxID=1934379 RepID=A0AAN6ZNU8_9PEZI|nr:CoA binding domain-containing protein [Dichotomopilus funicola]
MAATTATLKAFFEAQKFAVVGASTNKAKFGYKVFEWYVYHDLLVTPVNPGSPEIEVDGKPFATVASLSALESPGVTAVSIITPPVVTQKTLAEAKELGIQAVFLQPGTFDDDVLAYARENFATVVAGPGGSSSNGEWCVLVDGERGLQAVGKL